ncbi:MAG: DUF3040 domain-containing protein [Salinibacterium sp.]|nr:MAG: DUF3040 domain-containing protein [Salinibacterium sp.]
MPLSEQEQRLLDEMERSLYQNDGDFVASVSSHARRSNYTVVVVGILIALLGISTLVAGVAVHQPVVGVLGFAVMFAGVWLAVAPPHRGNRVVDSDEYSTRRSGGQSTFMENLNARWDKRQEGRN